MREGVQESVEEDENEKEEEEGEEEEKVGKESRGLRDARWGRK